MLTLIVAAGLLLTLSAFYREYRSHQATRFCYVRLSDWTVESLRRLREDCAADAALHAQLIALENEWGELVDRHNRILQGHGEAPIGAADVTQYTGSRA